MATVACLQWVTSGRRSLSRLFQIHIVEAEGMMWQSIHPIPGKGPHSPQARGSVPS